MDSVLDLLRFIGLVLLVLVVFNLMIIVHEWGHFLAARWRGLKVEKFQIWFGKPIWKKTYNGVQYGLGCIPAGGFVALPQMAPVEAIEGSSDEPREVLPPIKPIDKIIVAFAGPLFSFLLAVFFAVMVYFVGRPVGPDQTSSVIGYVFPEGAAAKEGLKAGDKVTHVDDQPVKRFNGLVDSVRWAIIASKEDKIKFTVQRDGQELNISVPAEKPKLEEPKGLMAKLRATIFGRPQLREVGIMGSEIPLIGGVQPYSPAEEAGIKANDTLLTVDGKPVYSRPALAALIKANPGKSFVLGLERNKKPLEVTITPRLPDKDPRKEDERTPMAGVRWYQEGKRDLIYPTPTEQVTDSVRTMFNTISSITSPKGDVSVSHMSGFLGIARVYYTLFKDPYNWQLVMWFSVLLNINLAIMNMLPFPVLDGGHIVTATIEWIRRRPINIRLLEIVQTACVLLLFGFMIFITFKDAGDFMGGGSKKEVIEDPSFLPPDQRGTAAPAAPANP